MLDSACKLMQELSVRVAVIVVSVSRVSSVKLLIRSAFRQVFPPAPAPPAPSNHPHISQAWQANVLQTLNQSALVNCWNTSVFQQKGWLYEKRVAFWRAPTSWRFVELQISCLFRHANSSNRESPRVCSVMCGFWIFCRVCKSISQLRMRMTHQVRSEPTAFL